MVEEPTPTTSAHAEERPTQGPTEQKGTDEATQYLADLNSADERVRARAAQALQQMGHAQALDACLQTLNDDPDPLHLDFTPAVWCLRQIGRPALPPLLDRLASDDRMTRMHALRAVEWITKSYFGFDGQAWQAGGLERWMQWWQTIGYDPEATAAKRLEAVNHLREWLHQQ